MRARATCASLACAVLLAAVPQVGVAKEDAGHDSMLLYLSGPLRSLSAKSRRAIMQATGTGVSLERLSPRAATTFVMSGRTDSLLRLRRALSDDRGVVAIERDPPVRALFAPNDPNYSAQWHLQAVNVETAWDLDVTEPIHGGDPSVVVAVIDSGVAYETYAGAASYTRAPDLAETSFVAGYDFVNGDEHPNDDNGHGTHVAGTVAESTDNGVAAAGMAFRASIMPVKVLDAAGNGTTSDVARGIDFAVQHGADVINLSLGSTTPSQALADAVTAALNAGVVVVAATGNEGQASVSYPAAYEGVIAVGAVGRDNVVASFSNYGTGTTLVAPGGDDGEFVWQQTFSNLDANNVPRDYVTFGVVGYQGTSQAAPHVAGAAALLLAQGVPAANVKAILESTATDLGPAGYDVQYGYGLVNVAAALQAFSGDTIAPAATATVSPVEADGDQGYYRTAPTVTLAAQDNAGGSGVAAIAYRWDTAATYLAYTSALTPPEGGHTLYYYATDVARNMSVVSTLSIAVDTDGPSITLTRPVGPSKRASVTVAGSITDAVSGVAALTLDGAPVTVAADGTFRVVRTFPLGKTTIALVGTDRAGATTHVALSVTVLSRASVLASIATAVPTRVARFAASGVRKARFAPFSVREPFGASIAAADVTGDGREEIITGLGRGGSPRVRVSTKDGRTLTSFFAYDERFRGGVFVAAGDLDGDGNDELITGPGAGGGPQVRVFNRRGELLTQFFAYDERFRGGVRVAAGDLDGDGKQSVIAAPGPGRAADVKVFSWTGKRRAAFLAAGTTFRDGMAVAAGDLDGDGKDEILAAASAGGQPRLRVFSGGGRRIRQFDVFTGSAKSGAWVAAASF